MAAFVNVAASEAFSAEKVDVAGIAGHGWRDISAEDDDGLRANGRRGVVQAALWTDVQSSALQNRCGETKAAGPNRLDTSKSHPAGSELSHPIALLCQKSSNRCVSLMRPPLVRCLMLGVRLDDNQPPRGERFSKRLLTLIEKQLANFLLPGPEIPIASQRPHLAIRPQARVAENPLDVWIALRSRRRYVAVVALWCRAISKDFIGIAVPDDLAAVAEGDSLAALGGPTRPTAVENLITIADSRLLRPPQRLSPGGRAGCIMCSGMLKQLILSPARS